MEESQEDEDIRQPRGRTRRRVNFQESGGRGLNRRASHVQRREGTARRAPHIRRQISRDEQRRRSSDESEPAFPTIMEKEDTPIEQSTSPMPPHAQQPHQPKGLPLNLPLPPAPPDFENQQSSSVRSVQEALVGAIRLAETSTPKSLPKSLSLSSLKSNVANAAAHVTSNSNLDGKERRHKVVDQLRNHVFGKVEHLVLNEKDTNVLDDCDYIDLLRALSANSTVKKVTIAADFISMLNVEEARIFLLIVASLPKLESFHLHFPEDQIVDAEILATMLQRARSCKEIVLNDMQLYAKSNDEMELLGEVLENLFRLENIRFVNLSWLGAEEDTVASSEGEDATIPSSIEEDEKEEEDGKEEQDKEEEEDFETDEGSKFSLDPIVLALSTLPNLKVLEIKMKYRYKWAGNSLGDLVTECPSLTRLALNNLSLQVTQVAALGQALVETNTDGDATDEDEEEAEDDPKKSHLQELVFDDCDLQYKCFLEIGHFIPENRTLLKLNLPNSINLTDDVCMTIATAIENDDYLQELDLSSNTNRTSITPRGLVTIARMLEKNSSLQSLSVTFTGADDSGIVAMAQALQRNTSLKKLFLENITPNVPTRGIVALAKALEEGKNATLKDLTLIFDGEDTEGLLAIATAMEASKTLKTCSLSRS